MTRHGSPARPDGCPADIAALLDAAGAELAGLSRGAPGAMGLAEAPAMLEALVSATERAAGEILDRADRIRDAAASLSDPGADRDAAAARIGHEATGIILACSFQDLTGQRLRGIAKGMAYLEARVQALEALWGGAGAPPPPDRDADRRPDAHLMRGPSADGLGQGAVDDLFGAPP